MKLSGLKSILRHRVASNPAIEAFCQEQFGRSATVLRRFDNHQPPGESDCPWVHLEFLGERKSNVSREVARTFMLSCGVWRDPEGGVDDAEDRASDLRELAEAALMSPGLGKVEPGDDVHGISNTVFV